MALKTLQDKGFRIREIRNEPVIQIRGYQVDTQKPEIHSTTAASALIATPSGRSYHILRLPGPMHPDWKNQLDQLGIIVYQTLAQDNYFDRCRQ